MSGRTIPICRFATTTRLFVLLILLVACPRGRADPWKCCAPGRVFAGVERVSCVPAPPHSMEIYALRESWLRNVTGLTADGFPDCDEAEDVETTPLDEMTPYDGLPSPACLEVLHEESEVRSVPLVVHCRSNRDRLEIVPAAPMPEFSNVRRCCPRDTVFDRALKTCVPELRDGNDPDDDDDLLDSQNRFVAMLPRDAVELLDFLTVSRGPPRCKYAIYDYLVSADDIVFRDHTLRVSLRSERKGAPIVEDLSVSGYEACLELSADDGDTTTTTTTKSRDLVLRACRPADFCDDHACLQKCCPEDEVSRRGCKKFAGPAPPLGFHEAVRNVTEATNATLDDYGLLVGNPCPYGMYPVHRNEGWTVTARGHVYVPSYETYGHDMYCMEIVDKSSNVHELDIYTFVCFDKPGDLNEPSSLRFEVNSALVLTSCAFILATLLVYVCLPSLQNLHGKTLMCHVASLLVAYSCLAIIGLASRMGDSSMSAALCQILGYLMLFTFTSSFSWLNVMCFDIWWTFGGLRGSQSRSHGHKKRFLGYCLYAWGLALVISILGIVADHADALPAHLRPNIGHDRCWFVQSPDMYGEVLFFVGPISAQLVLNLVFFVLTSVHCSKVKAEIRRVIDDRSDPRSRRFHADRTKLIMNVKLFVVMGISWVLEIVSYFLNNYATNLQWRVEFFYVSDALNCLQGLLIFILFVLKTRVYLALRKRLGLDKDQRKMSNNTTTALDPFRVKKSGSSSTLMSTFNVSVAP